MTEIKRTAIGQLEREGGAGLSLRAIARDLGIVSSAIYRYVPSRDDLLTLLIVDAYNSLGGAAEAAERRCRRTDLRRRWFAIGRAVRRWALTHRAEYGLLYGSPVPGYVAPPGQTNVPGTRVSFLLLRLATDLEAAGAPLPDPTSPPRPLDRDLRRLRTYAERAISEPRLAALLLAWTAMFGLVSFELFGQYNGVVGAHAAYFDHQLDRLAATLGLGEASRPSDRRSIRRTA